MGYPFWLKNQADKANDEKQKYQKTATRLVKDVETLLNDFEKDGNPEELVSKLNESIKKLKEEI